jgi:glycosyltransferase involved in cell wall biosynthesis
MAAEYSAADLFVMSSRWEGLPMTLLEAQHFGLPSVSTDCPTGPREVLSGGAGRLVAPEDPQALADGLVELMFDQQLRDCMGSRANTNSKRFGIVQAQAAWAKVLSELYC